MLRIDVDQKPGNLPPNANPASVPGTYLIPADNPFVGATSFNGLTVNSNNVRTEFWAVACAIPFVSPSTAHGRLYAGDVGQESYEEVNLITPAAITAGCSGKARMPPRASPASRRLDSPITSIRCMNIPGAPAPPGQDDHRRPGLSWQSHLAIVRLLRVRRLHSTAKSGRSNTTHERSHFQTLANQPALVGFGSTRGMATCWPRASTTTRFTGWFTYQTASRELPAPDAGGHRHLCRSRRAHANAGILPYDLNVPFWSDNALKSRWVSVPDTTSPSLHAPTTGPFQWPVWIKHFELE